MKKARNFLKNFVLISIPTFVLLFLVFEFIVFRFVLCASQVPRLEFDKEYIILKPSTNGKRTGFHSMGKWAKNTTRWQVNNFGWISDHDYQKSKHQPRLAIIGDSYIMGLVVNTDESFPELLHESLKDNMDVYSFGMAGSPLSNYLNMSRYVVANFNPDILLINVVFNDFNESVYDFSDPSLRRRFWTYKITKDSLINEIPPESLSLDEGRLNGLLKSCATGRYLYHNLKVTKLRRLFKKETSNPASINRQNTTIRLPLVKKAVEYTIGQFKAEFPGKRIIITIDALRKAIYDDSRFDESSLNKYRLILKEACAVHDVELIDFSTHFHTDYRENKTRFEFEIDPHWNAHAHQLIAQVLYDYLRE